MRKPASGYNIDSVKSVVEVDELKSSRQSEIVHKNDLWTIFLYYILHSKLSMYERACTKVHITYEQS